ncbi:MAG: DUF4349 domain-containing protein [Chloroflexi bacterium]|nr:DUF4349 domain-containing protein [Chloroflexota bacterium]
MKRYIVAVVLVVLLISALTACAAATRQEEAPAPVMERLAVATVVVERDVAAWSVQPETAAAVSSDEVLQEIAQAERKVIYNANMTLTVTDTDATARKIEEMATNMGGYVANMNAWRGQGDIMYYTITLRIPADQFDAAREALRQMAVRVDSDNISTDDVTDQYYDIEARLKALRATETELLELLAETRERGGSVEDIMSIHRELSRVQGEIESLQGQLNRLDKLVAFSTISVDLRPHELAQPITTDEWQPLETLRNSIRTLVRALQGLLDLTIYLVVVVLPILLILAIPLALFVLLIRRLARRTKKE